MGFKERLKNACDGGKESKIMDDERGVVTLIWRSRFEATRAE